MHPQAALASECPKLANPATARSDITMTTVKKITGVELQKLVRSIVKESMDATMLTAGEDGKLRAYLKKVESLMNETFEKADKLAEEGEALIVENYLSNPTAAERKRVVMTMIGYLRQVRNNMGDILKLKKLVG